MSDKEIIFLIEESLDGGYEAKALGHSIFTEGNSVSELKNNIKDAVKCHFESKKIPKVIRLHFIREELIAV
jgi:predicted RNase H-like HicB family nuclease